MKRTLAGVDGCRGGWIAAVEEPGKSPALLVRPRFADLLSELAPDALFAVDMPIGLPDRIRGMGRAAEIHGRQRLPPGRRSSLFPMPARAAVEAGAGPFGDNEERRAAHRRVCALARAASDPPRAVSAQGFALFPRILELDRLLRDDPVLVTRVFESHPEIAFAVIGDGRPFQPKKRGGRPCAEAMRERRALLWEKGLPAELLEAERPRGAGEDDRLDACILLLVARRIRDGVALRFPDPPERDRFDLPIAIRA